MKYNMLTFIENAGVDKHQKRLWKMRCDCGNEKIVSANYVKCGKVKSCGCLRKQGNGRKHGKRHHPLYSTWCNLKARCFNKNHPAYKNYGGRGITVCSEWVNSFEQFLKDVGEKPTKQSTLDRIDNNGNYSPENVRWADRVTQRRNSRATREVTIGNQTKLITDWCDIFAISIASVHRRLNKGESVVSALTRSKAERFR